MKAIVRSPLLLLTLTLAAACGVETSPPSPAGSEPDPWEELDQPQDDVPDYGDQIDVFIRSLPDMAVADPLPKTETKCAVDCPEPKQEGNFYCTYKHFAETAQFDRFVTFQPNSATLWPGAIVRGKDAQDGMLTPIGLELAPVTFSISLENIAASPVGYMETPSLSAFRDARNAILGAELTGVAAAAFEFEVSQVHASSDLSLAIGGGVKWPGGAQISGSFDFSSSEKQTKIVVNFTQAYYTIDVDTPTRPSDFFASTVKLDQIKQHVDSTSPPLYVQSITFGRRVIFTVESNESAENIKAALEATYKGALKANGQVSASHQEMLQKSNIKAFVYGGSGSAATAAITGFEGLIDYIKQGGDYSKDSPGAPISYKLAYLDNDVTKLAFTTEYTAKVCEKNRATLRIEFLGLDHTGGDDNGTKVELNAGIALRYPQATNPVTSCEAGGLVKPVWDLGNDGYVSFPKFTTYKPASPVVVYVHDVPIDADQVLCLSGAATEIDWPSELTPDDDFGSGSISLKYSDGWAGEQVLHLYGSGESAVDLRVNIEIL